MTKRLWRRIFIGSGILLACSLCHCSSSDVAGGRGDAGDAGDAGGRSDSGISSLGDGGLNDGGSADSGTTDAGTMFPAGTICNNTGANRAPPAHLKHVLMILMENKDQGSVDSASAAPYFTSLLGQCGYTSQFLDNVFSVDLVSLPHYLALTSGSNCNTGLGIGDGGCITDDNDPGSHLLSTTSIFNQVSWKSYQESMPGACGGTTSGQYAAKHNPPVYYSQLSGVCSGDDVSISAVSCPTSTNSNCGTPSNALTSDLAGDTLPAFSFVTPNLTNDMHNGTIAQGDNWLHTYLPLIFNSAPYRRGEMAVYVLWDEQGNFTSGATPNLIISPYTPPTASTVQVNLFSALRTVEEQLGVSYLGCAGGTAPGGGSCPAGSTTSMRSAFNF